MRWLAPVLLIAGFGTQALAQDLDVLRGSEPVGPATFTNWTGFYVGGQIGYNGVNADFSKSTQAPIAYVMRNTLLEATSNPSQLPVLGTADHAGVGYGGFAGYNSQWQNLMVGVEGNFTHTAVSLLAPSNPISRSNLSDGAGNAYTVTIAATGTLADLDYGTLRARAGVILGSFLPYGFVGFAVGLANVNVTATVHGVCDTGSSANCGPFAFSATGGKDAAILYGVAAGAGLDYALTQNLFLRGEYEYLRFAPIGDVPITVSSARIGGGIKF